MLRKKESISLKLRYPIIVRITTLVSILLLITLTLPVLFLISSATYSAKMEKVTPDYKRPDGH